MSTQTCTDCGKRGPNAGDFGGQCASCYGATMRDWISGDDDVDAELDLCDLCGGSGDVMHDDITLCPCYRCGGSGIEP